VLDGTCQDDSVGVADAVLAAAILAADPHCIGGVLLKASPGPARDAWLRLVRDLLPAGAPFRRVPISVSDDRLLGGLDLSATIAAGRPVAQRGLLAEADSGLLVLSSAERLPAATAAKFANALDLGEVRAERDGIAQRLPARFGIVALDEGLAQDERPPTSLVERLAIHLTLDDRLVVDGAAPSRTDVARARTGSHAVGVPGRVVEALCSAALALGVSAPTAALSAVRVARIAAVLANRLSVSDADAALAARLVLAPRTTVIPAESSEDRQEEPEAGDDASSSEPTESGSLEDVVVAAAKAAVPPDLLARLRGPNNVRLRNAATGRAGAHQKSPRRGRQMGTRRGAPSPGARLDLIETLRAAAPWQRLRRPETIGKSASSRVAVRSDDFRVKRLKHRTETTTIFVVDASGSTALHRLGEAKGAVELLLADCYVRRDQVALIAFSGRGAQLLLPPTRSLARARRNLADLPSGGATPLASGIDLAAALADSVCRKGQTPGIVLLTDGRANLGRNGKPGRGQAQEDALAAAGALREAGLAAIVIDTSKSPEPQAAQVADAMGAHYVALPHADAQSLAAAVQREMRGRQR
jgi:magnesium chelatase subunit D